MRRRAGDSGGPLIPIEETRCGRDLIQIGEKKGRREGRREGRAEGIEKGREALIEAVRQVLQDRFGRIPARILRLLERQRDADGLLSIHRTAVKARDLESFLEQVRER